MKNWNPDLSPAAQDFILQLMHLDPEQRMSVRDALHHPWLSEGSAEVATRCDLRVMQRQRPLAADDDSQSLPTSEGSRSTATTFTPSKGTHISLNALSPAPRPKESKVQPTRPEEPQVQDVGLSAPTLLQHVSRSFNEPGLPTATKGK